MKAMIFAAGIGSRFKPWTDSHPKALALVNKKSLLQRNVEYLQANGIFDVVINVHHFSEQIIDAVQENNGWGSNILISDETEEVLETGGGLMKAMSFLNTDEPFVTINADILTDISITDLLLFHNQNESLISLSVSNRISTRNFLFNDKNRLCGWENKTTGERKISIQEAALYSMAYCCVAIFNPSVFNLITQKGKFSLTDVYLSLAEKNLVLGKDCSANKFIDVGKSESVAIAEKLFI
jgi:NDP-sugar pyrophosphorylase family protein